MRFTNLACLVGIAVLGHAAPGSTPTDTRLLSQPSVFGNRVAFVYDGDLWTATVGGDDVRRLTSARGDEQRPVFSPDGARIAFSANYDGNVDVYVVSSTGGTPTRLTWHPGDDVVQTFSADGKSVLFTSERASFTARYAQLYEVPADGGNEVRIPIPNVSRAAISSDGARIAYNPLPPFATYPQWKGYRGGAVARVWLYDRRTHATETIPQPTTGANDADPMWVGGTVYFRSDRDGEFNLYAYDVETKQVRQLTRHSDFPVLYPSADKSTGQVVYEQAGYLHILDPRSNAPRKLTIAVGADLREARPRFVRGVDHIRRAVVSPSGARALFEFRGELVTVPAEKGDIRNLTNTPGAHERSPAWSPDGARIASVSDQSGEYEIIVTNQDGTGRKQFKPGGAGYYADLEWAPDGRRLTYLDNSQSVFVLDVETGKSTRLGGNVSYLPEELFQPDPTWSPDSKWVAYVVNVEPMVRALMLYSIDRSQSYRITDGLAEVGEPAFDPNGKYLYLLASTDAGPLEDWFSQTSEGLRRTRTVFAVALRRDAPNPVAKETDEERGATGRAPADSSRADSSVRVDLEDFDSRIVTLPIPSGDLSGLVATADGTLLYLREVDGVRALHRYRLRGRKNETVLPNVDQYRLAADRSHVLYRGGRDWFIVDLAGPVKPGDGRIRADQIEVAIDPRAEWAEMYVDAWRINRDYFYAPNMHGADWPAVRRKYEQFVPDLATRADLNRLFEWMGSELGVGHHYITAVGDRLDPPARIPGGLLGADYAVANGRYRFERIFGGLNWTPDLRAPLREPGVDVRVGDYLLAVNGRDLRSTENLYSAFVNTADKWTELTVGPNPDGSGSRTVQVVPIADERAIRNRAWVEGNLRKVDSATGGRVAYVYVPNTTTAGYTFFRRYFYPQAHKDGIIVDERYNGGGSAADYYIEALRRAPLTYWATRQGGDLPNPAAAIAGPKVLLINETAGSGGDYFPWMFKKYKIGPVIGKKTWGGLVGILGFPILMDGGAITAPDFAAWTRDEGWIVENEGVAPDIEVEQTPAQVIAGHDPQLERAIEQVKAELAKSPPAALKRPAYPVKFPRR